MDDGMGSELFSSCVKNHPEAKLPAEVDEVVLHLLDRHLFDPFRTLFHALGFYTYLFELG